MEEQAGNQNGTLAAKVTTTPVVTTTSAPFVTSPLPDDDNVRSVKKDMAVPIPGIDSDHRNSGKKDLDMTSEEMTGGVKARKGVKEARVAGRKAR